MMNRKLLAVVLPLMAATTVVGSGFAAWYFGSNLESKSTDLSLVVDKDVASTGTIEYTYKLLGSEEEAEFTNQPVRLVLSQGYGVENKDNTDYGIHFEINLGTEKEDWKALDAIKYTHTVSNEGLTNLDKAAYSVKISESISFDTTLLTYLDVKQVTGEGVPANSWSQNKLSVDSSSLNKYSATTVLAAEGAEGNLVTTGEFKFNSTESKHSGVNFYNGNAMLKYKDGKKPANENDVKAMTEALAGVTKAITIEFKVEVVAKE